MAAKEKDILHAGISLLNQADFAGATKQRLEEFANVQAELLKTLQEANEHWCNRIAAEPRFKGTSHRS